MAPPDLGGRLVVSRRVCDPGYVTPGSTKRPCDLCAQPIWVSPATSAVARNQGVTGYVCLQCTEKLPPPNETAAPSPGQWREILDKTPAQDVPRVRRLTKALTGQEPPSDG